MRVNAVVIAAFAGVAIARPVAPQQDAAEQVEKFAGVEELLGSKTDIVSETVDKRSIVKDLEGFTRPQIERRGGLPVLSSLGLPIKRQVDAIAALLSGLALNARQAEDLAKRGLSTSQTEGLTKELGGLGLPIKERQLPPIDPTTLLKGLPLKARQLPTFDLGTLLPVKRDAEDLTENLDKLDLPLEERQLPTFDLGTLLPVKREELPVDTADLGLASEHEKLPIDPESLDLPIKERQLDGLTGALGGLGLPIKERQLDGLTGLTKGLGGLGLPIKERQLDGLTGLTKGLGGLGLPIKREELPASLDHTLPTALPEQADGSLQADGNLGIQCIKDEQGQCKTSKPEAESEVSEPLAENKEELNFVKTVQDAIPV